MSFGHCYNQPTILPSSVISVSFGWDYNQPTIFPPTIKEIKFYGNHIAQYFEQLYSNYNLISIGICIPILEEHVAKNTHNLMLKQLNLLNTLIGDL